MSAPVQALFVTLKRSFAGTQERHVRILRSLGFSYRQQTLAKPNTAHIRGAIDKASRGQALLSHRVAPRCSCARPAAGGPAAVGLLA